MDHPHSNGHTPIPSSKNVLSAGSFSVPAGQLPESEIAKGLSRFSEEEQKLRIQLAAAYRYFSHMGWDEIVYNHITVSVPSPDPEIQHFFDQPFRFKVQ